MTGDLGKRICILRHFYYPADPRVRKEVEALNEAGYRVDVICLRKPGEKAKERVAGATVYRTPLQHRRGRLLSYGLEYGLFLLLASILVSAFHIRRRYHVVQINSMPDFLVFAATVPKLLGAKIVFDSHELVPELYASKWNCSIDGPAPRILKLIERWSCRFADHVISVTDICKNRLASRSVSPDKCTVVMNVADSRIFDVCLRADGHHKKDTFTVLYHGALIYRYGVDVAIRAMKIVKEKNPNCRLEVIGDGEQLPELRKLVSELGLEKEVHVWGRAIPAEEIARLVAISDVGVVPHRGDPYTDEILPNKLLECVAMRTPVIASRTRVVQSYFDDSMLLFFEPDNEQQLAEHIVRLAADSQLASNLAANAERFNAVYNWSTMKETYCKVIEACAMGARGPN